MDDDLSLKIGNKNLPIKYITNKEVYWKLIKQIQIPHVTKIKWESELNIKSKQWGNIFYNSFKIRDTKIRAFQYKLIMNLVPCNLYLYRIGKTDSHKCNYCDEIDDTLHFFYECNEVRLFWTSLQNWWNVMMNDNFVINKTNSLLGIMGKNALKDKLNAVLQLARYYIYIEKLNIQHPFLYKFLCNLKYKIKIEKIIYAKNNQTAKFDIMWEQIEEHID